jgi:hypothetical protein
MDHVTNEPPRRAGGDKHTPQAKVDIARREQQIVALRLRGISFHEIGRVIGISRISAYRAFHKALRRNTDQDIQTHHRSELAELEAEQANVWRAMDANKDDWRAQMSGTAQLRGIHVRRAKLLGLDAPTKLDVRGLYRAGADEISAERQARRAVLEALPIEEQRRIFEVFYQARKRVEAGDFSQPAIETTVNNGSNQRSAPDESDDGAEHNDEN